MGSGYSPSIPPKISNEVWEWQTRWKEKRDTYAGVVRVTSGLIRTFSQLIPLPAGSEEAKRLGEERVKFMAELIRYEALITIFANNQAVKAFETFLAANTETNEEVAFAIAELHQSITEIAKQDLGLSAQADRTPGA